MVLSTSLSRYLENSSFLIELNNRTRNREALILPAFEPAEAGMASRLVTQLSSRGRVLPVLLSSYHPKFKLIHQIRAVSKNQLKLLYSKRIVTQFKGHIFPQGHRCTDYKRWFQAKMEYTVPWQANCEPWFISNWDVLPWFDVQFRCVIASHHNAFFPPKLSNFFRSAGDLVRIKYLFWPLLTIASSSLRCVMFKCTRSVTFSNHYLLNDTANAKFLANSSLSWGNSI